MIANVRLNKVLLSLAAIVAALFLASGQARAQTVAFKVTGGGYAAFIPSTLDTPASHFAIGTATELGEYFCW